MTMRKTILASAALGFAALALTPGLAGAQPYYHHHYYHHRYYNERCGYERHRSTATGAVAGTIGGALIGGAISHNAGGALLGAGAGALAGGAIGHNSHRC
jgi:hypothetical protein